MIHSFACENFYSIKDRIEIDLTVNDNAPNEASYATSSVGDRVSLVEAVLGPNASGKTNLLKILPFANWLIVDSYIYDPEDTLPVKPFAGTPDTPSYLSVTFSIDKRLFRYDFTLNRELIISEKLFEKNKTTERVTWKIIFSREWNDKKEEYSFTDKVFGVTQDKLRKNASAVSTAFRDKNPLATLIAKYWKSRFETNVYEVGYRNHAKSPVLHDRLTHQAIDFFYDNKELKEQVENLLCKYDLGFGKFKREELQDNVFFSVEHTFDHGKFDIPIAYESSGTKQMIIILQYLLVALARGGMVVIDELDSNLHPEIVEEIVSMFTSKELNPNAAQLFFSSHTPTILSSLSKYQVILVEKNSQGQTDAWRLDSIKGVRPDDNYYTKYMAGAYGATPNLG